MRHERGQRGGAVRLAVELEEQRRKQQARRLGEGGGERWGEGWGKGWGESWGEGWGEGRAGVAVALYSLGQKGGVRGACLRGRDMILQLEERQLVRGQQLLRQHHPRRLCAPHGGGARRAVRGGRWVRRAVGAEGSARGGGRCAAARAGAARGGAVGPGWRAPERFAPSWSATPTPAMASSPWEATMVPRQMSMTHAARRGVVRSTPRSEPRPSVITGVRVLRIWHAATDRCR